MSGAGEIKKEPHADLRLMASTVRQMFVALVDEGFSPQEALVIVGQVLHAHLGPK